jgi:hypothetical protein
LLAIICILAFASACFAQTGETVEAMSVDRAASEWAVGDLYFLYTYVYASGDVNKKPARIIVGNWNFVWNVWTPKTQIYWRHYIVSDPTGTIVSYAPYSGSMTGGQYNEITYGGPSLPDGDYTFTVVVAGEESDMAISDPFKFSVRSY